MSGRKIGIQLALLGGLLMADPFAFGVPSAGGIEGMWGGDRMRLMIDANGAGRVELDCASGAIAGPIVVSKAGTFAAVGTFEQHRNGPQPADETPTISKARYEGAVEDGTMTLSIWPGDASKPQVFKLRKGAVVKLVRCL